jgi:16S rRNA (cytosine967-C5)-methyltransferase
VLAALLAVRRGRGLDRELARLRRHLAADQEAVAVAEELVRGVLQWQGRYDHLIARFSRRRATGDPVVRTVLQLALHQLLTSRGVPAYAAIHQAGELLRAERRPRAVGYANAVLQGVQRHVAATVPEDPLAAVAPFFDLPPALTGSGPVPGGPAAAAAPAGSGGLEPAAAALAAWWSHPRWLVERWCARFGVAETAALLAHANTPAPVTLHVLPGTDPGAAASALADAGAACTPLPGFPRALRLEGRHGRRQLRQLLQVAPGLLVQDAAAQAVVDWLTRGGDDLVGLAAPVVDLCAAPGGKALHLRALAPPAVPVLAVDRHRRRLVRLRENRDRLATAALPLLVADATAAPLRPASCAAVLVDGPCSGTGVARHHPEGRWRLRPGTLTRNADRLLALAGAAADLLVPGGCLYYATCSLEPEENEDVIARLLQGRDDLAPAADAAGAHERHWNGWQAGTDSFYAARVVRRGEPGAGTAGVAAGEGRRGP